MQVQILQDLLVHFLEEGLVDPVELDAVVDDEDDFIQEVRVPGADASLEVHFDDLQAVHLDVGSLHIQALFLDQPDSDH